MLFSRAWRHSLVLLAGCGLLVSVGLHLPVNAAAADELPTEESLAPVEGILVMRTGAVVSGKLVRSGDSYKVISRYGQMQVPAELVKLRCADLNEAYLKLRETAQAHKSANAQITLARWCLTNHLDNEARQELREALVLEPNSEDAKRLLRDAEDSLRSKQKVEPAVGSGSAGRGVSPATSAATPADDDTVTLGGLSREQALQFTRRIQPLLVNTCASAGCHSRDSQSGFRLSNVSPGMNANRNATERNLAKILEHVDLKQPRSSTLLTAPRRRHGRNSRPVFVGHRGDERFAELENWVVAVARDEVQRSQNEARRKSGAERAAAASHGESRATLGVRSTATGGKKLPEADPFAPPQTDATSSQGPLPPATVDPFDASSFNRTSSRSAGR